MTTSTAFPTIEPELIDHQLSQPAGWYPDPWFPDPIGSASWLRYWDGSDWTDETALTVGDDAQEAAPLESFLEDLLTEPALDDVPAATPPAYQIIQNTQAAGSKQVSKPTRAWSKAAGLVLLVCWGLLAMAILAAASRNHQTPKRAKTSARSVQPTLPALGLRVTSPVDGATVHSRSVVIRGVVSRSRARVTVNGDSVVASGHRFAIRVPLRLGYNEFDISAAKTRLAPGTSSVSIVRVRSASERAELAARRAAQRSATQPQQQSSGAQQSGGTSVAAPVTSAGVSGSATGTPADAGGAADADLQRLPLNAGAQSAPAPTP